MHHWKVFFISSSLSRLVVEKSIARVNPAWTAGTILSNRHYGRALLNLVVIRQRARRWYMAKTFGNLWFIDVGRTCCLCFLMMHVVGYTSERNKKHLVDDVVFSSLIITLGNSLLLSLHRDKSKSVQIYCCYFSD